MDYGFFAAPQQSFPYYPYGGTVQQANQDVGDSNQFQLPTVAPTPAEQPFAPAFHPYESHQVQYQDEHHQQLPHPQQYNETGSSSSRSMTAASSIHHGSNGGVLTSKSELLEPVDPIDSCVANAFEDSDDIHIDREPARSSSEEKDSSNDKLQDRRKAQNRAAQRAFRERKERRVRDLEEELTSYKKNVSSLLEDNETLKRQITKISTENEILRATSHSAIHQPAQPSRTDPVKFSLKKYSDFKLEKVRVVSRVETNEETGDKLLEAPAAWELIVNSLSEQGSKLNIQDVYDRLRGCAQCDGTGPVVGRSQVLKAIRDSIAAREG